MDTVQVMNTISSIVMIQTDKPVYKPNDVLRYQIVALDVTTKPIELNQIQVDIFDAKDNKILSENYKNITKSKFGFYQDELTIADEPNIGTWTIKVQINGQETDTKKYFVVQPYVLSSFKVNIDAPPMISFHLRTLVFDVSASYSFDKPVIGKAMGKVTVYFDKESIEPISVFKLKSKNVGTQKVTYEVDFEDDLELNFVAKQLYIVIDMEFEEEATGVKVNGSKQIILLPSGKHDINLNRPNTFRPGFNYTFKGTVRTRDGELEKPTTLPFTISYQYGYAKKPKVPLKSIISTHLKSGVGIITITPPVDAIRIDYTITYDQTKLTGNVNVHQSSDNDEFIQITLLDEM